MKRNIGGYAILDLTSETIYNDALALANVDKPILIYPENDKPVFADTFTIDSDNDVVIITIGGLTITIANDNTITTSGNIQPVEKYLHNIKLVYNPTYNDDLCICFQLRLTNDSITTLSDLINIFKENENKIFVATGYIETSPGNYGNIVLIKFTNTTIQVFKNGDESPTNTHTYTSLVTNNATFIDSVN